jgi:hypothetical protein
MTNVKKNSIDSERLMRQRSDPASDPDRLFQITIRPGPKVPDPHATKDLNRSRKRKIFKARLLWLRTRHAARVCTWDVFSATNASSLGWRIAPLPLLYSPSFLAYQNIHTLRAL